ncbi:IclR family transcriptional regulator [Salinisphaera sp. Q1T1-3]|uniref:IclR family transcriptional regulator n=1 Tax=Salinisphaera sp. Q1T1-3 TaxID=2321229 RepID=UPI000E741C44|nr:IclR family transcriptional regulator [Salinisphaera sp. Q1T1-3]RJS94922.1 IclR family transcriptional regulator [Salinisphaera sp. Q1T1-3]
MIQSVERALAILEHLAHAGGASSLQHIASDIGTRSTTAHNLLQTLVALGYVRRRANDTRYHLGERILNLSRVVGDDRGLCRQLRPTLEAIARETGETVFVAVPSGDEVYFLDAIESQKPLRASSQAGERQPMAGSAIGLLFLALDPGLRRHGMDVHADRLGPSLDRTLETIAARGYALDQNNYQAGLSCIAVPWVSNGSLRAGFGLSGPSARLTSKRLKEAAAIMQRLAARA